MSLTVAIMQPYFLPYAGYFRLFHAVDKFVFLDCVQFPRRGWVHRNQLTDTNGNSQWLTLPLLKGDRDTTKIQNLIFQNNPSKIIQENFLKFPCSSTIKRNYPDLYNAITIIEKPPTQYIIDLLKTIIKILDLNMPEIIISSDLSISSELKAERRILEISKIIGAAIYINSPGGRDLYNTNSFNQNNIELKFLSNYSGSFISIIERLANETVAVIRSEIIENCHLC